VSCLGRNFWIPKQSKTSILMWLNSSVGNVLFFVFWWHHMVVGSTLWHVIMLFLSDSSGNNHVKHNKAIHIRVYLWEYISMFFYHWDLVELQITLYVI